MLWHAVVAVKKRCNLDFFMNVCTRCHLFSILAIVCIELFGASIAHSSYKSTISINLGSTDDLPAILALDVAISYEHFKPIFLLYPEYDGKEYEVEKMLAAEVETDATWFADCLAMIDQQRLFVAYDENDYVGFVACHQHDNSIVVIDLLMVNEECRGKGIGKQLIQTCIKTFPQASTCMLVVLDKNEQACAAYERMGFVVTEKPEFMQKKYPKPRYICYRLPCKNKG